MWSAMMLPMIVYNFTLYGVNTDKPTSYRVEKLCTQYLLTKLKCKKIVLKCMNKKEIQFKYQ